MGSSSLLWSLCPPEGKCSWLFGTMHVRDERVYQSCQSLYPLILQADVFVGEMDLHPPDVPSIMQQYDMKAHFTSSAFEKIRKQFLKSFHLDIHRYHQLHPLMLMSALSHRLLENDHAISLDEHLWNFATGNGVAVQGLETMKEQLDLLHAIDPVPLYAQIKAIGSKPSGLRRHTEKSLQDYLCHDIHALYHHTKSSMHELRRQLIFERNRRMADRIAGFDSLTSFFISVGAGHLSGRYGLLSLLRKKGWKVKPYIDLIPAGGL